MFVNYKNAYQYMQNRFRCSPAEMTMWCYLSSSQSKYFGELGEPDKRARLHAYSDALQESNFSSTEAYKTKLRSLQVNIATLEISDLSSTLTGFYFCQDELHSLDDNFGSQWGRYLTYCELLQRWVNAGGKEFELEERLTAQFRQSANNSKDKTPYPDHRSNNLGMLWPFNFIGHHYTNAVYTKEKILQFLELQFDSHPAVAELKSELRKLESKGSGPERMRAATKLIVELLTAMHTKYDSQNLPKPMNALFDLCKDLSHEIYSGTMSTFQSYNQKTKKDPAIFKISNTHDENYWQSIRKLIY